MSCETRPPWREASPGRAMMFGQDMPPGFVQGLVVYSLEQFPAPLGSAIDFFFLQPSFSVETPKVTFIFWSRFGSPLIRFRFSAAMLVQTVLVAAMAATALAQGEPYMAKRTLEAIVAARQALPTGSACLSAYESVLGHAPTPAPALLSYELAVSATGLCTITFPASLSSEVEAYQSGLSSWYTTYSNSMNSIFSSCSITSGTAFSSNCGLIAQATAPPSSQTKNASPRETGRVAAAIVAAGLGVAAAL